MNADALPNGCYTAAQISSAAGLSKRRVLKRLEVSRPSQTVIIHGNETSAWTLAALPESIRSRLARRAYASSQTIAGLIETVSEPWLSRVALAELSEASLAAARKLRDALLPALNLSGGRNDAIARAEADYKRVFGHAISERHIRRLIERTMHRDGNQGQLDRIELYVSDQPAKRREKEKAPAPAAFETLAETVAAFRDPAKPTHKEIAALWAEAFEIYESESGIRSERKARVALIGFLWRSVPGIAKSENALRVGFARKHERWKAGKGLIESLFDKRLAKRGEARANPLPQQDRDRIIYTAAERFRGKARPAVRALRRQGQLSEEAIQILGQSKSKSYLPSRIAKDLAAEIRMIRPYLLGKQAIDDATASLDRDYSDVKSMDMITLDDFTLNTYFWIPDGKGWYLITRGQNILCADYGSRRLLQYSLQPESHYDSTILFSVLNKTILEFGLPRMVNVERGMFKRSRLFNRMPSKWQKLSNPELRCGWDELGVRLIHSRTARAKSIEGIGGQLQNLLDGLPGYAGREERHDCPEETRRAKLAVESRREEPWKYFLSYDEYDCELKRAMVAYNLEPQQGRVCGGLSPEQKFQKTWAQDKMTRLDENCWHLIACYKQRLAVDEKGISFTINGETNRFFGLETSDLRGKEVWAYWDPENPDLLGITDINGKNPRTLKRHRPPSVLAEQGDPLLAEELARAAAHSSYPKARFHSLKTQFKLNFRTNVVLPGVAEAARVFKSDRDNILAATQERQTRTRKVHHKAERVGVPGALLRGSPDDLTAVEMIEAAKREHEANQKGKSL